jgi:hypothetical protein
MPAAQTSRPLRDRLGECLHRHACHDDPLSWETPAYDFVPRLSESSKEEWRGAADRILNELAPACGIVILAAHESKEQGHFIMRSRDGTPLSEGWFD